MTDPVSNVSALLPAALAATTPFLSKVRGAQEKIVTLNVDIGKAFGEAIAAAHAEPLAYTAFCDTYQAPLQRHCIEALGYLSANALQVMLRTANLAAASKAIPTRAAVLKRNGKEKPLSDTAFLDLLRDAQRKAGLTVAKPGCGGDNRSPEQIAEAATKAAAEAAAKAAAAAKAGAPVAAPVAPVAPVAPPVAGKPDAAPVAPPVAPTIDVKKAREDAAAMLMGNAKNGDLLLQALTSRKAALIQWLQAKPKA
jgi:hypothetical protein